EGCIFFLPFGCVFLELTISGFLCQPHPFHFLTDALVSVTDHDRVDTVASIAAPAAEKGLPVLPGVEMSTDWNGKMGHVLCYGFDPQQNYLIEITEAVVRKQLENTHAVHDELLKRGYTFPREEEVLAENGGKLRRPVDN